MGFRVRGFLSTSVISFLFFAGAVFGLRANEDCRQRLTTLSALTSIVEKNLSVLQQTRQLILPSFNDFQREIEASKTWEGVRAPRMIQELLPDGVRLIDHSLISANEPGLVKDHGSGEFLSIRASAQGIGTNMGILRQSLVDNSKRSEKSLVRKDAKAVILFGHGGGTRTTGHHVVINLMNHFAPLGVDVISFDQPWHAEGPRVHFRDAREYYEWLRALIRRHLSPAGLPIIVAGHSMGGELADVYRRLYPGDTLVSGVISLSTVVDPTPGLSMEERIKWSEAHDAEIHSDKSPTPEDKKLLEDLLKSGKTSITASFFEGVLNASNSWIVKEEDKERLLPALYVWGSKDWLYLGNEAVIEKYLKPLPKTEVAVFGRRYDFDLKMDVDIGHMIFDHYRPGTQDIETFALIREFLQKYYGIEFSKGTKGDPEDLIKKVVQAYANVLSFREFAKTVSVSRRVANPEKIKALNERIAAFGPEDRSPERKRLTELRKGFYLPEGLDGDLGRQWHAELNEVKQQELKLRKRRDSVLRVELESLRRRQKALEKSLEAASHQITNSPLNQLGKLEEQLFVSLKGKYDEINQLLGDYWIRRERGEVNERPPEGLQKLMNEFEEIQRNYQHSKMKIQQRLQEDALSGAFGLEMRAMAVELWGEAKTHQGERASAGSLVWKMEKLQDEIDAVEDEMSQYQERYEFLQRSLIDRYSDGVFSVETYSLADILERPYADWETYISFIQDAWSRWQVLWKERPAVGKASFY